MPRQVVEDAVQAVVANPAARQPSELCGQPVAPPWPEPVGVPFEQACRHVGLAVDEQAQDRLERERLPSLDDPLLQRFLAQGIERVAIGKPAGTLSGAQAEVSYPGAVERTVALQPVQIEQLELLARHEPVDVAKQ